MYRPNASSQRGYLDDVVRQCVVVHGQQTDVYAAIDAMWLRFGDEALPLTITQWQNQVHCAIRRLKDAGARSVGHARCAGDELVQLGILGRQ